MGAKPLATGLVDNLTSLTVYADGTFTTARGLLMRSSAPDKLISFEHDSDSMRRKSVSGRGAAALATGGISLLASNNRGVVYVTVIGQQTGVVTFTTRNPAGSLLTSIRSLKAAAEVVLAPAVGQPAASGGVDVVRQLQQLADLLAAGTLSAEEFAAAKARLLAD